jgi:hypothetical protein
LSFSSFFALTLAAAAQPFVLKPGISIFPFAGAAAGQPPLVSPKFGVIDAPGGPFMGMMYISELAGADVVQINPRGMTFPYTFPLGGPFPDGAYGVDIDGPVANLFMIPVPPGPLPPTMGMFGGPPNMYVNEQGNLPMIHVMPGGAWNPFLPSIGNPGAAQLQFDRTVGFIYGGSLFASDWGADNTDSIMRITPAGPVPFAALPNLDPRYFTFDVSGGAAGFGPGFMWVSSYNNGSVFPVLPNGQPGAPIAILQPDLEGLAFAPGDQYFGMGLYACNLTRGDIDIIQPGGAVIPFVRGLPGAAYPMFVTQGPFAKNGNPTLYVADGMSSVWVLLHCPADFNNDGFVNSQDFFDFLRDFFAMNNAADFNNDGVINSQDFFDFLNVFFTPCI